MAMVEYPVDRRQKHRIAARRVAATRGGKIAVAATILAALLTFIVPWYILNFTEGLSNDPEDGALFEAGACAIAFGALTVMGAGATWRQRNRGASMRKDERLTFDGRYLVHMFHPSADDWVEGLVLARVDMLATSVVYDSAQSRYIFEGGVRWGCFRNADELLASGEAGLRPTGAHDIGAYFGGGFDCLVSGYIWT